MGDYRPEITAASRDANGTRPAYLVLPDVAPGTVAEVGLDHRIREGNVQP